MCVNDAVPGSVTRRFGRAETLIDRAATRSGKQARKLHKRTRKVLKAAEIKATRAAKGKRARIPADCARLLKSAAENVAGGLGE